MEVLIQLIFFLILLGIGYFVGLHYEQKHYKDIKIREKRTLHVPTISFGAKTAMPEANDVAMFTGSVVVV